jgi:hypothetical protein
MWHPERQCRAIILRSNDPATAPAAFLTFRTTGCRPIMHCMSGLSVRIVSCLSRSRARAG